MRDLKKLLSFSLLGTLFAFFTQILAANILSLYDYGVVARWLTDLSLFSIFFIMGLDHALMYFTKNNIDNYNNILKFNFLFFTFTAILLSLSLSLIFSDGYWISLIATCYLIALFQSLNAYNQICENIKIFGLNIFLKSFIIFLVISFISLNNYKINWQDYVCVYVGAVASVLIFIFFKYIIKVEKKTSEFKVPISNYFSYGLKSMSNAIIAIILYSSTTYMVDYYLGKEGVAIFFAATVISKLAWVVPDAIGNILYPKFIKIKSIEELNKTLNLMYTYAQLNFTLNLISVIIFSFVGWYFIDIIYGEKYKNLYLLIVILLLGNQGMVYYKLLGRYYASINKWGIQRESLFWGLISNVLLNIILINCFGLLGSSIATAISFWICGFKMTKGIKGSFKSFLNLRLLFNEVKR